MKDTLPKPKSVTHEVLLALIENNTVSIKKFPTLSGFRTRISELKNFYKVNIETRMLTGVNKYGRKFKYACHYLPIDEIENAESIYLRMCKEEVNQ